MNTLPITEKNLSSFLRVYHNLNNFCLLEISRNASYTDSLSKSYELRHDMKEKEVENVIYSLTNESYHSIVVC